MTATAEPPSEVAAADRGRLDGLTGDWTPLDRAEGLELLGSVAGSGYRNGAALVRRPDGQIVQLGPLMYGLLEQVDGHQDIDHLAAALSQQLGRELDPEHVVRLAEKLADQGLLAGTEEYAPPRRNPLLALRWRILVTNPEVTGRLTAPFAFLFRPWVMWPILAMFAGVFWFVLIDKGVSGATAEALNSPGLLLLVFALAVLSAGFHEMGHAAACRYGGATPGGMGAGLYLVWPAFYTDVTDTYRLPRMARLRVDLAGLYFNAVVAVATMAVWLLVRVDALLLLVALQVLQMVKQLSPIIRADGYHILSDATGVPDLYSHMGPTLRRLLPWRRREPSALTGWARLLVTAWVLIVVPILLALMLGAVIVLPRIATSVWDSGRRILDALPRQASHGQVVGILASSLRLVALFLPVAGSALIAQKLLRTVVNKVRRWSEASPRRRTLVFLVAAGIAVGAAWAWWPSGQYQPVRAGQGGTLSDLAGLVASPGRDAPSSAATSLAPGTHLAVAMIPAGGVTKAHPAVFLISGTKGKATTVVVNAPGSTSSVPAAAFPFTLPAAPGPHGTQALAVGTKAGGVTYDVAYSLVTVTGGAPVDETNTAYALADCRGCTTVAVSFQVVLVVGQSNVIAPVDAAGALNQNCPSCSTTAIADQIVVTLSSIPSPQLLTQLNAALRQLNALSKLGAHGTPAAIATEVAAVQQQIDTQLARSGLVTNSTSATTIASSPTTVPSDGAPTTTAATGGASTAGSSPSPATSAPPTTGPPVSSAPTTSPSSTAPTTSSPPTTVAPPA